MMTVRQFCEKHNACQTGRDWVESIGLIDAPMADLWARADIRYEWCEWIATRPGVCSDRDLRLYACRCVRETPLADGRRVWDLLTDPRSRAAVETAERFANGEATAEELAAAWTAASAAAWDAASAAASAAAWTAARDAARDAASAAARDAASAAAWTAARTAAWTAARDAESAWLRDLPVNFEVQP